MYPKIRRLTERYNQAEVPTIYLPSGLLAASSRDPLLRDERDSKVDAPRVKAARSLSGPRLTTSRRVFQQLVTLSSIVQPFAVRIDLFTRLVYGRFYRLKR